MAMAAAASPSFAAAAVSRSLPSAGTSSSSSSSPLSPPVWSRSERQQQAFCSSTCSPFFRSALPRAKTSSRLRCSPRSYSGMAFASAAEPKWKQKLAAADQHAEQTRQLTMQAQEDYKRRQDSLRRQQAGAGDLTSLQDLEFIPYLTEEGLVTDCSSADAKATVYAIFGEDKSLHYIGISRQVAPSLRLHFARVPMKCFYIKLQHVTKPNRALLESIKDKWISENGAPPDGNDNAEQQNIWENPLDCKPLMLDNERKLLEEAAPGPPTAKVLKDVARRIEKDLEASFKLRNCSEKLRFDPKLKERGLLDIKNAPPRPPSKEVPTTDLKAAPPTV